MMRQQKQGLLLSTFCQWFSKCYFHEPPHFPAPVSFQAAPSCLDGKYH